MASLNNLQIRRVSEDECARLLLANMVEIALLSPLGYGRGVTNSDFRIIPSTACLLRGWTHTGSIIFAQHLGDVHGMASAHPTDYLMQCAAIILDEQYEITAAIESKVGDAKQLLETSEGVLCWQKDEGDLRGLDISEEWDMAFAMPLPMAMWVCRAEYLLDAGSAQPEREAFLLQLTRSFAAEQLPDMEQCLEAEAIADTDAREGLIEWKWSEDFEQALDQTLQLLFQRTLLPQIPAIKVVGREQENELSNEVGLS